MLVFYAILSALHFTDAAEPKRLRLSSPQVRSALTSLPEDVRNHILSFSVIERIIAHRSFRSFFQRYVDYFMLGGDSVEFLGEIIPLHEVNERELAFDSFWIRNRSDFAPLVGDPALNTPEIILAVLNDRPLPDSPALDALRAFCNAYLRDLRGVETSIRESAVSGNSDVLTIDDVRRADLSPLPRFSGLRKLILDCIEIVDLLPIAGLTHLSELHFIECGITGFEVLAGLNGLVKLDLFRCSYGDDISVIAGLTRLRALDLANSPTTEIASISRLTALELLNLNYCRSVADFTPLSGLTRLKELSMDSTSFADLSILAPLTRLERLAIPEELPLDAAAFPNLVELNEDYQIDIYSTELD
jgi:hypothetical protein